jgi:hypothetical protein
MNLGKISAKIPEGAIAENLARHQFQYQQHQANYSTKKPAKPSATLKNSARLMLR